MRRILAEPLVHFLVLGAALFLVYGHFNASLPDDARTIVIDRERLLNYLQYRSRTFDRQHFDQLLNSLGPAQIRDIIRDYSREEALYREAKAMGLDKNDYVARLRLIQQLEFVTRGFLHAEETLPDAELERYYARHKVEYLEKPNVTFAQVFFDAQRHGTTEARRLASEELKSLNAGQVPFEQASAYGDRYLYPVNYVQRDSDEIASYFGTQMQRDVFALAPDATTWKGPFRSPYGYHLVMLTRSEQGSIPSLNSIREPVEQDALRELESARFEQAIQRIVREYKIVVQPDVGR